VPLYGFTRGDFQFTSSVDEPLCLGLGSGVAGQIRIHQMGMFLKQPHEELLQFLRAEKLLWQARDQQHVVIGSAERFGLGV